MRKFVYRRGAEPVSIASCDISSWKNLRNTIKECPEIHIVAIACYHAGKEPANILTVLQMRGDHTLVDEDFRMNYVEIFRGGYKAWKLITLEIEAGRILFKYYDPANEHYEQLELNISGTQIALFNLTVEVPRQDQRPSTEYVITMEQDMVDYCNPSTDHNSPPRSATTVEEYRPWLNQRTLFQLSTDKPDEVLVTEYVDL